MAARSGAENFSNQLFMRGVSMNVIITALRSIIKRSRASERSDQVIKDDFHRSKFLIPIANDSTGDVYVTTPSSSCMMACMPSVTIPLHGWMIVPCTAAVSLKIKFARLQGGFVRTPSNPPWLWACTHLMFWGLHPWILQYSSTARVH